jgi:flagellum-specific ATP synthase
MNFAAVRTVVKQNDFYRRQGKIEKIIGRTIEASGPVCNIGDVCMVYHKGLKHGEFIYAEVVGFQDGKVMLMPYTDIEGIGPGSIVDNTGRQLEVNVGEALKGRIINAIGQPIDGQGKIKTTERYSIAGEPVNPLTRPRISEVIPFGVKAIDGLLTIGQGQRIGIFAGSGVGKSTLMGMIAREVEADINVIALVGERGR